MGSNASLPEAFLHQVSPTNALLPNNSLEPTRRFAPPLMPRVSALRFDASLPRPHEINTEKGVRRESPSACGPSDGTRSGPSTIGSFQSDRHSPSRYACHPAARMI